MPSTTLGSLSVKLDSTSSASHEEPHFHSARPETAAESVSSLSHESYCWPNWLNTPPRTRRSCPWYCVLTPDSRPTPKR